ncbi:ParB/RepB/Spo0J family partition protein [Candidatus Poribacteria bacterium]|nr:ParB/RepB/Spo0J family partition protein [Candidatus Poribacteria bacterium]MYA55384.1 ParB/RepB/Spo0J family partition protein [Candidatus Poribacteria bacterium]
MMNTIQMIDVTAIDPDSTINVRRQGVEENVKKVKASIKQHGYWPDQPIVIRPHPDTHSTYDYQNVTGQCRLKACLALGLKEIPAFIEKLNDDEAIQRSWGENEARESLSASDKAYWTEKIYKQYEGNGHTANEAMKLAAEFLGVEVITIQKYYRLVYLPKTVMEMVNSKVLTETAADAIATNTIDSYNIERSKQAMEDRASWYLGLGRDDRKHAIETIKQLGNKASITDLNANLKKRREESRLVVEYAIPTELYDDLLQWGIERGLDNERVIIGHMIAETLKR